jgi:hypothetical protein
MTYASASAGWFWIHRVAAVLAIALLTLNSSAQSRDLLSDLPSVAAVKTKVTGSDAFDTAARQSGAFRFLRDLVTDLSMGRDVTNRLTERERALMAAYVQASSDATRTAEAVLAKAGAPAKGPDSPGPKSFRASEHYHYDPAFRRELVRALFAPGFAETYDSAMAKRNQRAALTSLNSAEPPRDASEWLERGGLLLTAALGTGGTLLALTAAALLGLTYPLVALWRSSRVAFWTTPGIVTSTKTWADQSTHYTPSYTDAQGHYRMGSNYTTTARCDEFMLQGTERSHAISLRNIPFPVASGHPVTAVWIGAKTKAKTWWPAHLRNHATRQSTPIPTACRLARGSSFTASSWWTFLLFTPACAVAYFAAGGGEHGIVLLVIVSIAGFSYWFLGGFAMKIVHMIGDRRILARARGYEMTQQSSAGA